MRCGGNSTRCLLEAAGPNTSHNLFYNTGQGAGTNQVSGDPMFVDPLNGDFHLRAGSPAIDSGTDMDLPALGAGPDIGVFEQ